MSISDFRMPGRVMIAFVLAVLLPLSAFMAVAVGTFGGERDERSAASIATDSLVSVIVQTNGDSDAATAAIEAAGGIVDRTFTLIPAVEARLTAAAVEALRDEPSVLGVTPNSAVESTYLTSDSPLTETAKMSDLSTADSTDAGSLPADYEAAIGEGSVFPAVVGATDVWNAGVTGTGVGIAVVDTGLLDADFTDFQNRVTTRVAIAGMSGFDFYGHGTHVAGIAAGDGQNSRGYFTGIAPRANLISIKVGTPDSAYVGDVMAGLEWIYNNHAAHNIRVVNISLSSTTAMSYRKDPLDAAVEALWFEGIVVVASAGNQGSDPFAVDHAPGNDPFVISVGGFSDNGTIDPKDDFLKDWSSRGVSHDGIAKPEIVAPGWRLVAAVGNNSVLYQSYPENQVSDHYLRLSGTSTSAPVVAGVVALMLEQNPQLMPDQVKARLLASAGRLSGSDAGRVDAFTAVFGKTSWSRGKGLKNPNAGFLPSLWINPETGQIDPLQLDGIGWDGIGWDGVGWDGVGWDGIGWDGVGWDGIGWDGIGWDGLGWDGVGWDGVGWDAVPND